MPEGPISDVLDVVDEVTEELFPPRPGGLIDRARKDAAARRAAEQEAQQSAERVEEHNYKSVKTTQISPEVVAMTTVTIQPGATAMILPNSPYRYRALISIDTATAKVVLAKDASQALGGVGFTYATGSPITLFTRAQVFGYNPGGAAITISVLAEIYAPEK